MGFRINKSSSWRTPLQMIDSLLPRQHAIQPTPPVFARCIRSFQRAGWLGRARQAGATVAVTPKEAGNDPDMDHAGQVAHPVRVIHTPDQPIVVPRRPSARLVISGRMADVCAELERLAAMEARIGRA